MEQQTAFTETIGTTTYTVTVSSAEDAKEKPEQQFLNLILASVKNCSQKVFIESPIMIRRPVVQGFL